MESFNETTSSDMATISVANYSDISPVRGPLVVPIYQQVIIITMYSIIILLSVFGNSIVCYIVFSSKRMRTVMNFFIVSLALSDILMAVICIPLTFVANLVINSWPFGDALCPVVTFLQVVTVFMSSFTLVAISLDRYSAIVHPLRPKMTKRQAFIVISIIWILSVVIPLPTAITSEVHQYINDTSAPYFCEEVWENITAQSIYNAIILIFQYFIPLMILVFTYGRIILVLWIKKPPGEAVSDRDERMSKSKKKIIKMMIVVVIIYSICWLPLHIINIAGDINITFYNLPGMNIMWTVSHWLAMSNCMYNPFIYCWMNAKYRNGFINVFSCFTCGLLKSRDEKIELQRMRGSHTNTTRPYIKIEVNARKYRGNSVPTLKIKWTSIDRHDSL
ncbi:RYamide receptor-like [Mercenaria mercenaria]|uniref:RYamide receptor-like n=1 Tax=Mercenaria mercenaria TaxID=6596 RepID=UPI001E1D2759|nr:RYamide receptor-like [Mercenaria mercenaria]XP_053393604.1 RYamide receptor-like [Mercenaria mercenaria]